MANAAVKQGETPNWFKCECGTYTLYNPVCGFCRTTAYRKDNASMFEALASVEFSEAK